jgi:hypothetical protein
MRLRSSLQSARSPIGPNQLSSSHWSPPPRFSSEPTKCIVDPTGGIASREPVLRAEGCFHSTCPFRSASRSFGRALDCRRRLQP